MSGNATTASIPTLATRRSAWLRGAGLALCLLLPVALAAAGGEVEPGRRLYERGLLGDGSALIGTRGDGSRVVGEQAACASCHRRSGMGSVEGDIQVPPITGNALFGTGDRVVASMDPRSGKAFNRTHADYTESTLATALRSGRRGDGQIMQVPMPRYALGSADLHALSAYLQQLSAGWSPGVTRDEIHFATVITPEVTPQRRAAFIDMVRKIVAQKNGSTMVAGNGRTRHHMASAAELVLGTERKWRFDVWELQGAPATWRAQLEARNAQDPVFALVSGLGDGDWSAVDGFCDRERIPCWFPSVMLPPSAAPAYSLYFNRGVALEAEVLASQWKDEGAEPGRAKPASALPARVIQIRRDDAASRGGAQALAAALASTGILVEERAIAGHDPAALAAVLQDLHDDDAVMYWLRADDLAALAAMPVPAAANFFSAELGGEALARLPADWQHSARLVYLQELPARRAANLAYFKAWMNQRHVPMVDELTQSEVYFAFAFLTDTVTEMLDNLHRDYLIERAENMISRREGSKAEAEYYSSTQSHVRTHAQRADGSIEAAPVSAEVAGLAAQRLAGTSFHVREGTSAYPRLSLGPGQRFASKGGYIARLGDGGTLLAASDWIVPVVP